MPLNQNADMGYWLHAGNALSNTMRLLAVLPVTLILLQQVTEDKSVICEEFSMHASSSIVKGEQQNLFLLFFSG